MRAESRNQRDKFSTTLRLAATTRRTRPRRPGSSRSTLPASNRQLRPPPGPLQTRAAACYKERVSPGRRADCTCGSAARPAAGQPGGRRGAGREGDASVDCGNEGILLGLPPTWESCLPFAQQQFPGRATPITGTETARALILFCLFPPDLPRGRAPPPNPKDFFEPENAPSPPPPCTGGRGSV